MVSTKKRCAILTISDCGNYGNRLQNYALSRIISGYSHVSTIRMLAHVNSKAKLGLLRVASPVLASRRILANARPKSVTACLKRLGNYKRFARNVPDSEYRLSAAAGFEKASSVPDPDIVIIGSDQVWNYRWLDRDDLKLRLGLFAPSERLVTYAASVGLEEIDPEWRSLFKEGWSRIPQISVREDRASEMVREIANRKAAVVLDPTLMMTSDQWSKVFTGFVQKSDRYVLTYFLGCPSEEQERVICAVAEKNNARIRRINDARDVETYAAGPAEFTELFSKALYVFTDSYHACCFSILYNRPFKVFNRVNKEGKSCMNSRMRTLFRLLEIDDLMSDDQALPTYDWAKVNSLLEQHRKESREWLENALGVKTWS